MAEECVLACALCSNNCAQHVHAVSVLASVCRHSETLTSNEMLYYMSSLAQIMRESTHSPGSNALFPAKRQKTGCPEFACPPKFGHKQTTHHTHK